MSVVDNGFDLDLRLRPDRRLAAQAALLVEFDLDVRLGELTGTRWRMPVDAATDPIGVPTRGVGEHETCNTDNDTCPLTCEGHRTCPDTQCDTCPDTQCDTCPPTCAGDTCPDTHCNTCPATCAGDTCPDTQCDTCPATCVGDTCPGTQCDTCPDTCAGGTCPDTQCITCETCPHSCVGTCDATCFHPVTGPAISCPDFISCQAC
jgi:hypothetical protein